MTNFTKHFFCWLTALRAYSLPISIMSWFVPFLCAAFNGGSIKYGFIAFLGIIILHLASNLFDDTVDYILTKRKIDLGLQKNFNFQPAKCICIFNHSLSISDYIYACLILFSLAVIIGIYFLSVWGIKLLAILIPSAVLCILYPILGCLGLGEIIIAIIFAPLIYLGTYFVMTGYFSLHVLILSISTGLLSVAVLHNHMLLDFNYDKANRKITLCRLCKTQENAFVLLWLILFSAYFNIIFWVSISFLNPIYLIVLFSIPTCYMLLKTMKNHIKDPSCDVKTNIFTGFMPELKKAAPQEKNFLTKFLLVRNLISLFTLLLCIAITVEKCIL